MSKVIDILLLCIVVVATSCYYDNEEALYPVTTTVRECDTTAVTYSASIAPVIALKCNSCHSITSAPSAGGNIILEGHMNMENVAATGKLLGAVTHAPGYSSMPKTGNKLSYCEITAIRRWIEANMPNN